MINLISSGLVAAGVTLLLDGRPLNNNSKALTAEEVTNIINTSQASRFVEVYGDALLRLIYDTAAGTNNESLGTSNRVDDNFNGFSGCLNFVTKPTKLLYDYAGRCSEGSYMRTWTKSATGLQTGLYGYQSLALGHNLSGSSPYNGPDFVHQSVKSFTKYEFLVPPVYNKPHDVTKVLTSDVHIYVWDDLLVYSVWTLNQYKKPTWRYEHQVGLRCPALQPPKYDSFQHIYADKLYKFIGHGVTQQCWMPAVQVNESLNLSSSEWHHVSVPVHMIKSLNIVITKRNIYPLKVVLNDDLGNSYVCKVLTIKRPWYSISLIDVPDWKLPYSSNVTYIIKCNRTTDKAIIQSNFIL